MKPAVKTWSTPSVPERRAAVPCALCGGESFAPYADCGAFSYVRCVRCFLVQQNPRPLAGEIAKRYEGGAYLRYERQNEDAFLRLALLGLKDAGFEDVEKSLFASGSRRILDVGCATGALLAFLRERGWEARGVELSAPQAEYARTTRGLDVTCGAFEASAYAPSFFNVALAFHVIEHAANPSLFVEAAARSLVAGGYFFVTTPNIDGFQARIFKGRWRSAIFDHIHLFSKKTLRALLERHDFVVESAATWGGLAAGSVWGPVKKIADVAVKPFGAGDVMIIRARKGASRGGS